MLARVRGARRQHRVGAVPAWSWARGARRQRPRRRRQPLPRSHLGVRRRRDRPPPSAGGGGDRRAGAASWCTVSATSPRTRRASSSRGGCAALAPVPDARVYFAVSGSDAVEIALKTALLATGRAGVARLRPRLPRHHAGRARRSPRARPSARRSPRHASRHARSVCPTAAPPSALDATARSPRREPRLRRRRAGGRARGRRSCRRAGWLADARRSARARAARWWSPTRSSPASAAPAPGSRATAEGVVPDLLCCGKALGGGLPIAAVLGGAALDGGVGPAGRGAPHRDLPRAPARLRRGARDPRRARRRSRCRDRAAALGSVARARAPRAGARSPASSTCAAAACCGRSSSPTRARRAERARRALERGLLLLTCGAEGRTLQLLPPLTIRPAAARDRARSPGGSAVPVNSGADATRVPMVDLAGAHAPLEAELQAAFTRVLRSGRFILGEEIDAFEREVAAALGVEHAIGCSSGTDALLAALMALDLEPGDEVLCPSFTFFATGGCVWRLGARPVFVDVSPESWNAEREHFEARIGPRTRAIVPVHLFGRLADMEPILDLGRRHGLPVIEDAAQALGAIDRGRPGGHLRRARMLLLLSHQEPRRLRRRRAGGGHRRRAGGEGPLAAQPRAVVALHPRDRRRQLPPRRAAGGAAARQAAARPGDERAPPPGRRALRRALRRRGPRRRSTVPPAAPATPIGPSRCPRPPARRTSSIST